MGRGEFALLPRESSRFSDYSEFDDFFWAEDIGAWISSDPATIRAVLKDCRFEVIDFRNVVSTLAQRTGLDFEPTQTVLNQVALGMKDAEHRQVRKAQTLFMKTNSDAALANFSAKLDECFDTHLSCDGAIDLAKDLVAPSIAAMFSVLTNDQETLHDNPSPSQIFDRMLSINKRKKINERLRSRMSEFSSHMSDEEISLRISLSVVGADTIFGSICQSLVAVLRNHDGQRISDMTWPDEIPQTGIPYVDRFASEDMEFEGRNVKAGDRTRLYVEAFLSDPKSRKSDLFGLGAHVCLGKALSMKSWTELVRRLRRTDARARVLDYEYRRPDFLFNAPSTFSVELKHG